MSRAVNQQNILQQRGMTIGTMSPALREGLMRIGATQAEEWVEPRRATRASA